MIAEMATKTASERRRHHHRSRISSNIIFTSTSRDLPATVFAERSQLTCCDLIATDRALLGAITPHVVGKCFGYYFLDGRISDKWTFSPLMTARFGRPLEMCDVNSMGQKPIKL